jgi:hypothetical protein
MMQGGAVGLYCAVGYWFDLRVSMCTIAARESQAVFNQRAVSLRAWLGALNLGLVEGWQRESENGAERPSGVRPQSSPVGIDDGAAYRQADSHGYNSLTLRRVDQVRAPAAAANRRAMRE